MRAWFSYWQSNFSRSVIIVDDFLVTDLYTSLSIYVFPDPHFPDKTRNCPSLRYCFAPWKAAVLWKWFLSSKAEIHCCFICFSIFFIVLFGNINHLKGTKIPVFLMMKGKFVLLPPKRSYHQQFNYIRIQRTGLSYIIINIADFSCFSWGM